MGVPVKKKNKKVLWPYYVIAGICGVIVICYFTGVAQIILFLFFTSKVVHNAENTNQAKKFIIPVEAYAQSHGWKSVQVINNPSVIDNSIPTYREVFLTSQTPYEVAPSVLNLIRQEGFINGSGITSEMVQTTIKNHYDLDLGGLDANGNKMMVTISTKEYANDDDSTTKISPGMTAVIVYTEYDGYLNQKQNVPAPSFSCVGSGCP